MTAINTSALMMPIMYDIKNEVFYIHLVVSLCLWDQDLQNASYIQRENRSKLWYLLVILYCRLIYPEQLYGHSCLGHKIHTLNAKKYEKNEDLPD